MSGDGYVRETVVSDATKGNLSSHPLGLTLFELGLLGVITRGDSHSVCLVETLQRAEWA
jgi:hypothetical protein